MLKLPLITILMPVKNAGKYLPETLDSISRQTCRNWELIAVDDASTDNSRQILSTFQSHDPRVQVYANTGEGIIPALNMAWEKSQGSYITRMDADDLMPPQKLEIILKAAEQHPRAVITGKVSYFTNNGTVSKGYRDYEQWLNERIELKDHWQWIYRECVIASPNWLVPRKVMEQMDAFTGLTYPEDYDLVFRWYRHQVPVVGLPNITHLWREHPERISRTSAHYGQEAFFALKTQRFLQIDLDPQRALLLFGEGRKKNLIARNLAEQGIPFQLITRRNISRLQEISHPQILVAVYPAQLARLEIEALFASLQLQHGKDYWWW